MSKRVVTEAEIVLEKQAMARLIKLGAEIVAHQPYTACSEKVKDALAKTMHADILALTGMVGSERDIKSMLEQIDPNFTFFRISRFNRKTGKTEELRSTICHDTIDEQIKTIVGYSIEDVLKRQELLSNPNKAK